MMPAAAEHIDALLIFPPLYAERLAGLIEDDLISDAGHPFEYPQGILSIASYLQSGVRGKRRFRARVLQLDPYIVTPGRERWGARTWRTSGDVDALACRIAEATVRQYRPRVVGISSPYYLAEPSALILATHLREQFGESIKIALGGQQVSFYDKPSRRPDGMLWLQTNARPVDFVVRKEGEFAMQEALERIADGRPLAGVRGITYRDEVGVHVNEDRPRGDPAHLPPLDNELLILPPNLGLEAFLSETNVSLVFVRGCPNAQCAFCTSPRWFGKVDKCGIEDPSTLDAVIRSARHTLEGLIRLGVRDIQLLDEVLNSNRRYFVEICRLLESLNRHCEPPLKLLAQTRVDHVTCDDLALMRGAGVTHLYLGLETGSKRVLDRMGKRVRTSLLGDAELVRRVRQLCARSRVPLGCFAPEIQQAVCACYLVKEAGLHIGAYMMIGHPGSNPAEEAESRRLVQLLYESGIFDPEDIFEVVVYVPLVGSAARDFPEVRIVEQDPRRWGRMSGHAVCDLVDPDTGCIVFSREEIDDAFRQMQSLIADYAGAYAPGSRTHPSHSLGPGSIWPQQLRLPLNGLTPPEEEP